MPLSTRDHFGEAILDLADEFPDALILNCDLAHATRTLGFRRAYPDRWIECGISEANAISVAAGLAQGGLRPMVCSFGHFLTGKFLEIMQSVGLNDAPVVLVGTHAGLAIGKDGPTQMGLRDVALMRTLPNMEIIHPADGGETIGAVRYILSCRRPVYLRLCRQPGAELHAESYSFDFGKISRVRDGTEILLAAQGATVESCLRAARRLALDDGVAVGVANFSSLPVRAGEFAKVARGYGRVLVVEDHYLKGGLMDELCRLVALERIYVPIQQIAVHDYGQAGDPEDLYRRYGLDPEGIQRMCRSLLAGQTTQELQ